MSPRTMLARRTRQGNGSDMSASGIPTSAAPVTAASSSYRFLLASFIAAIFVSAALLFAVQPMFTKGGLAGPGGGGGVGSVAMVFFQPALLGGSAYAPALPRFAPGRASVVIHLAVTVAACFALPLHIATGWGRPPLAGE